MTRIKLIVLAVLAVFCMSAVAATAAMANEGEFVKKGGGELVSKAFTGKSGKTLLETAKGTKVECKEDSAAGVILSKETGEETVTFKGCTSTFGVTCTGGSEGTRKAKEGEIIVLVGTQTRRKSQPEGEILLLLLVRKAGSKEAGTFSFECFGVKAEVRGSFLVPVGPSGKPAKTFTFTATEKKGVQEPIEYENSNKEKIKEKLETSTNGGAFESSGQSGAEEVTFGEEAEFK